jgi:hypothetical protein
MRGGTKVSVGVTASPPAYVHITTATLDVLVTLKSNNARPTNGLNFFVQALAPLQTPVGGLLGPSYLAATKAVAGRAASDGATFATPLRAAAEA